MMPELSTREKEVAVAAWRCFPAGDFPKVDYEALAKAADFNTVKSASNAFGAFKSKLMAAEDPTKVDLTDRDLSVARSAWLCIHAGTIPKINAALMVEMGIFKTAKGADHTKTATNTWWKIKTKLQADTGGNNSAAGPSTPGQSAMPKTGKRKATDSAQGTSDASTSSKKPRKARKTKTSTQVKKEASDTAEETAAEESPAQNPQTPVTFPAYVNGAVFAPVT